ncbi:MAG: Gfo/Idh/MocA family oxidoreductase, partial [Sulfobacillus thermotolerans]|nr:Gfo/Idh/MocA family oxidoreductase [Sulfobacillus thermotolerans]
PPQQHHEVVSLALSRGIHVLAEKPLSISVREGREMVALATKTRRLLAVAENYRRDPMNRLAKALLDSQVIGQPFLMVQHSFSASGEWVIISPWRHRKDVGGIALDMGVHYADLFEYFCGPVDYVMGASQVVDGVRIGNDGQQYMADAEDLVLGVLGFKNGALGSFTMNLAGRGESAFYRAIYGTRGSLNVGPDRTGRALVVTLREGKADQQLAESDVWSLIPHFQLDPVTARLFEAERLFSYALDWPLVDANLIAIEQADFFDAVLADRSPEVDGLQGLRSVALIDALVQARRTSIVPIDSFLGGADSPSARAD